MSLSGVQTSRSFMQKKGLKMHQKGVLIAGGEKRQALTDKEKCFQQLVQSAAKKPRFLLNQKGTDRFTAENALRKQKIKDNK